MHLLEQERAGDEIVEKVKRDNERKKRESWWGKGKAALGLVPKEGVDEDEARYGRVQHREERKDVLPGERLLEEERWIGDKNEGKSVTESVRQMVDERRRDGEKEVERVSNIHGGPLDVLAQNVTEAVKTKTTGETGWLNWGRGKNQS